jgi:hypothetical protein
VTTKDSAIAAHTRTDSFNFGVSTNSAAFGNDGSTFSYTCDGTNGLHGSYSIERTNATGVSAVGRFYQGGTILRNLGSAGTSDGIFSRGATEVRNLVRQYPNTRFIIQVYYNGAYVDEAGVDCIF